METILPVKLQEKPRPLLRQVLARFSNYFRPHRSSLLIAALTLAVILASSFGQLAVLRHLFTQIAAQKGILAPLRWSIPLMIALTVLRGGAALLQEKAMLVIRQDVMGRLRTDMLARMLATDIAYLQSRPSGWYPRRMGNNLSVLYNISGAKLEATLRNIGVALSAAAFLIWTDWRFSLTSFVLFAIVSIPQYRLHKTWTASNERYLELTSRMTDYSSYVFSSVRRVQTYCREADEIGRVEDYIRDADVEDFRKTKMRAVSGLVFESVGAVALWVPLLIVGLEIERGYYSAATLPSLVSGLMALRYSLRSLVTVPVDLQSGVDALRQIAETLDLPTAIADMPDAVPLEVEGGALRCQGVSFTYGKGKLALRQVDLEVPAGAQVALVGTSGSGKSTLLSLLIRLYDPIDGRIEIDGMDIRRVTLRSLRGAIAFVGQDGRVLNETVHVNIAYGRPGATRAEVVAAARMAEAHEFIQELPEGYDTILGDYGRTLSSGQQQRLALARGIVMRAPIMLMDEPTSALDSETEDRILTNMAPFLAQRSSIVVAHRLSTIVEADRIYVMDEGQIVEQGTHSSLVLQGGPYARMWRQQSEAV